MGYLKNAPTMGDVMCWTFMSIGVLCSVLLIRVPFVLARFEAECQALNAKLSSITVALLSVPNWAWIVVPWMVNATLFVLIIRSKNTKLNIGAVIIGQ